MRLIDSYARDVRKAEETVRYYEMCLERAKKRHALLVERLEKGRVRWGPEAQLDSEGRLNLVVQYDPKTKTHKLGLPDEQRNKLSA